MKQQVDANKCIDAQRPEIEGLMDINTFEIIPKINLPPQTRYLDLIWMLIPQVRPAQKYPNSPWEMIHPPGGDNAVCM
jgi:hypothetical protein